jgi:hypothetical protein
MGTMARGGTVLLLAVVVLAGTVSAVEAGESAGSVAAQRPRAVVSGGHDGKTSWLVARYRELQVRTRADRAAFATAIELRAGADVVNISVARQSVAVSRGDRSVVIDSPEALEAVQHLLGGSVAVFGVRAMLSDLEPVSPLTAPDMALLSTAAFIASLVGDVGAPQRIADRFMVKHRGIFRQVRGSGECWSEYTKETTTAWDQLQDCMEDADDKGILRAAYERVACNAVWLLRSESAWFEYLKCLSPLSVIPQ